MVLTCTWSAITKKRHSPLRTYSMFRKRLAVGFTFCAIVLVVAPMEAKAQCKPFKIVGGGFAPNGIPLLVDGNKAASCDREHSVCDESAFAMD